MLADEFIKQRVQPLGIPPTALEALWGDDDEWEFFAFLDEFGGTVLGDQFEVVAPLARAVQEQQQRKFLFAVIPIGQILEVFVGSLFDWPQ